MSNDIFVQLLVFIGDQFKAVGETAQIRKHQVVKVRLLLEELAVVVNIAGEGEDTREVALPVVFVFVVH